MFGCGRGSPISASTMFPVSGHDGVGWIIPKWSKRSITASAHYPTDACVNKKPREYFIKDATTIRARDHDLNHYPLGRV